MMHVSWFKNVFGALEQTALKAGFPKLVSALATLSTTIWKWRLGSIVEKLL
jgi:hypothetical protein